MVPYNPPRRIVRHVSGPGTGPIGDRYVDDRGDWWEVVIMGGATTGESRGMIVDGTIVEE